jgi:hypothetical protein
VYSPLSGRQGHLICHQWTVELREPPPRRGKTDRSCHLILGLSRAAPLILPIPWAGFELGGLHVRAGMFNWGLNPPQRAVYVIQEQVCCTERAYSRQAPHGAGLLSADYRYSELLLPKGRVAVGRVSAHDEDEY